MIDSVQPVRYERLGDICATTSGGTPSRSQPEYFGGSIPWVKSGDLNDGSIIGVEETISSLGLERSSAKLMPKGTVLIAMYGATVGKLGLLEIEAATNQAVCGIQTPETLDRMYLFYLLLARRPDLIRRSMGGAQPNISQKIIRDLLVPVPPMPEQLRVVDLLSRAQNIVRMRRQAEQQAKEIIPALFLDMFGDPATNPKGWSVRELGDLCSRITDGTHQSPKFEATGIPFLFVTNIVHGHMNFDTEKFISEETHRELTRRCPIDVGDVLYSTVGSYGVPVKVEVVRPFAFQRHIAHLKPNRTLLNADFLVGMLSTPALRAQADTAARGVAQKTVNLGEIRRFRVLAPPLDAQEAFAGRVIGLHGLEALQATGTGRAQQAFQSLMAGVFGESKGQWQNARQEGIDL